MIRHKRFGYNLNVVLSGSLSQKVAIDKTKHPFRCTSKCHMPYTTKLQSISFFFQTPYVDRIGCFFILQRLVFINNVPCDWHDYVLVNVLAKT